MSGWVVEWVGWWVGGVDVSPGTSLGWVGQHMQRPPRP